MTETLDRGSLTGGQPRSEPDCDDTRSVAAIERCAASTRQKLSQTLQQVEERLSPTRLYDEALGYMRQATAKGRSFSLDRAVSRNPLPFAVAGIGLALVGAGLAGLSLKKMGDGASGGRKPHERLLRWDEAMPEDIPPTQWETEAVIPPAPAAAALNTRLEGEDEASTEEVQMGIRHTRERRKDRFR
ncbi:MAG: DUF3618 domain-containing protein [Desulfobacterales bacterium]